MQNIFLRCAKPSQGGQWVLRAAVASACLVATAAGAEPDGGDADAGGPAVPTAIVSAPSIKSNPILSAPPLQPASQGAGAAAGSAAPSGVVAASAETGAPAVLPHDLHPWPLRYREPPALNALLLDIPPVAEARLLLPGRAADAVENARFAANKYINDAVGAAAQARSRQFDAFSQWQATTDGMARKLDSADNWQLYQFRLEARREVTQYRERIGRQATDALQRMAVDVKSAVGRIAAVMHLMPTYELRMGWYGVMVQIRDGVTLYQTQVRAADSQLLARLDEYLAANPVIPRPAGTPPDRSLGAPKAAAAREPVPQLAPAQVARAPSKAVPEPKAESPMAGFVVAGVLVAAIAGLVLKLRRRKLVVADAQK